MDEFNQRFIDLSINNPVPNRYVGINSLAQLDSVLNKFSASLKTIELTLDSLEVNKFSENIAAQQIWIDKFELLQNDVDLQREIHALINEKCNVYLSSLESEEDAMHFQHKINQINYRWNAIRMRITALRNYIEANDEQSKQLLLNIRELIDWISKCKTQLNNTHILAGDLVTAAKQKNDHRLFFNKIEDKRSIVESTLMAGRHFLATEGNIENDYADFDLIDCMRREVKKLSEKWLDLCQHTENKERILEDIYLKLNSLQKQIEDASQRLHTAELNKNRFIPINEITSEKITAHLGELKSFREKIFPLQNNIEQVNSLANLIQQCNVPLSHINLNHLEELNTRWKLLKLSIEERQKALEKSAPTSAPTTIADQQNTQMLNLATVFPWERLQVAETKVPYYLNHNTKQTLWDHPKMTELLNNLAKFNDIRYAAYRLALKLRVIQKKLGLDLIYIHNLNAVFDQHALKNDNNITVPEMISFLNSVYNTVINNSYINTSLCIDLGLNWMLNLFDTAARTGSIRVNSFKIALIVFCKATIDEKYLYMFRLVSDSNGLVDELKLASLFQNLLQIPTYLGESAAFGGPLIDYSVRSCLERSNKYEIEFRDFLCWVQREPQSLVWLAVFHRVIHSENTKHLNVRCSSCRMMPIIGLRYKCMQCFNVDFCQTCFFYGQTIRGHKFTHPMQEYCVTTTAGENVLDFTRIICNKFKPKNLFMKRNYYGQVQNSYMNDMNNYTTMVMMQNGVDGSLEQQYQMQQQIQQLAYQQQLSQMNQINQMNQLNQINQMNQMNQVNPMNQINQMNQLNQVSPLNQAVPINQNMIVQQQNQLMPNQIPTINQPVPLNNNNTLGVPTVINPTMNQLTPTTIPATTISPQIVQPNLIHQSQSPVINPLSTPIIAQSTLNRNQPNAHTRPIPQANNSLAKNEAYYNNANYNNDYYMINSNRSPAQVLDTIEAQQREDLKRIIAQLAEENRALQMEFERTRMDKLNTAKHQSNWPNMMNSIEEELNNNMAYIQRREDELAEANALKHPRDQLERRMEIYEEHNHQLADQLNRLKMMPGNEQTLNGTTVGVLHPIEKTTTTSILKNSNNPISSRRDQHKSIHFSKNNMVVDDFESIR